MSEAAREAVSGQRLGAEIKDFQRERTILEDPREAIGAFASGNRDVVFFIDGRRFFLTQEGKMIVDRYVQTPHDLDEPELFGPHEYDPSQAQKFGDYSHGLFLAIERVRTRYESVNEEERNEFKLREIVDAVLAEMRSEGCEFEDNNARERREYKKSPIRYFLDETLRRIDSVDYLESSDVDKLPAGSFSFPRPKKS